MTTHRRILVKFVAGNVVDGEDKLDVVLLGFFDQPSNLFGSRSIKERVADLKNA
jgi:hypothetical protein